MRTSNTQRKVNEENYNTIDRERSDTVPIASAPHEISLEAFPGFNMTDSLLYLTSGHLNPQLKESRWWSHSSDNQAIGLIGMRTRKARMLQTLELVM